MKMIHIRPRRIVHSATPVLAIVAAAALISAPGPGRGVSYEQRSLSASLDGTRVVARTTVAASKATHAERFGVCVRSATGDNLDFGKTSADIETTGTDYTSPGKTFEPGTYTYFACLRTDGSWHNVGDRKTFTVPDDAPTPTPSTSTTSTTSSTGTVTKLLTIVEENHSLRRMQSGMPYLYGLARRFSYADHYTAIRHPSFPNYLAMTAGSTLGVTDDGQPAAHKLSGQSVFGQAVSSGLTSGSYIESMPGRCVLSGNTDKGYAVKHNPQAYFVDEREQCQLTNLPDDTFQSDARKDRLPNVGMLIPNKCNDAHDTEYGCDLRVADRWLEQRLPTVLRSDDFRSGRLAVVVTADEDDYSQSNTVLTVVLHASLDGSHKVVSTPLNHYSLARLYSQVIGAEPLRQAKDASDMAAAFDLPVAGGR